MSHTLLHGRLYFQRYFTHENSSGKTLPFSFVDGHNSEKGRLASERGTKVESSKGEEQNPLRPIGQKQENYELACTRKRK